MINQVVLIGRLTKDPELKQTQTGINYAWFSLAVDRPRSSHSVEDKTDFIDCIIWREHAVAFCKYVQKGRLIAITGQVRTGKYDDAKGQRVYRTNVEVNSFQFLDSRKPATMPQTTDPFASETAPAAMAEDDLPF